VSLNQYETSCYLRLCRQILIREIIKTPRELVKRLK